MNTITIRCQINPREIGYLNNIFEGYPGFAVVRTDDAKLGLIQLWVSPDFYPEVIEILHDLSNSLYLKIIDIVS
ncbi:MAG: DUF4911 domain-containing protein [bacterium]|nr:DUF4911 domain-containing protein [bacterium]